MKVRFPILGLATLVAVMSASLMGAQDGEKPSPGLKVGDKAPTFTLKDQEGRDRSLDDLLKKGKVALVFYRSADW